MQTSIPSFYGSKLFPYLSKNYNKVYFLSH